MQLLKVIHKWLSLIVGIQLILWLVSGLVFSLLDPEQVKGKYLSSQHAPANIAATRQLLDHGDILASYDRQAVREITLTTLLSRSVYRVVLADRVDLVDANRGDSITITAAMARAIADWDYSGERGDIRSIDKVEAPTLETRRHQGPAWRVAIDDSINTTLYISAEDGQLLERRNDIWRVFDFFWMLHIMDYRERQDFNNPLVICLAFACLWLVVSGCVLLVNSLLPAGFTVFSRRRRGPVPVKVYTDAGLLLRELQLPPGDVLIDALAGQGVQLASLCGGGGSCGRCRVRMDAGAPVSDDDKALLSAESLSKGYRLACRQRIDGPASLTLVDV